MSLAISSSSIPRASARDLGVFEPLPQQHFDGLGKFFLVGFGKVGAFEVVCEHLVEGVEVSFAFYQDGARGGVEVVYARHQA